MNYVAMYCSNCGRKFMNPCIDDCAHLCEECRKTVALDNEIKDKFTKEELDKLAAGPVSDIYSPDSPDTVGSDDDDNEDDYFDNDDDDLVSFDDYELDPLEDLDDDLQDDEEE